MKLIKPFKNLFLQKKNSKHNEKLEKMKWIVKKCTKASEPRNNRRKLGYLNALRKKYMPPEQSHQEIDR